MTITPTPGTEKRRRKLVDWNLGEGRGASRPDPPAGTGKADRPPTGPPRRKWGRSRAAADGSGNGEGAGVGVGRDGPAPRRASDKRPPDDAERSWGPPARSTAARLDTGEGPEKGTRPEKGPETGKGTGSEKSLGLEAGAGSEKGVGSENGAGSEKSVGLEKSVETEKGAPAVDPRMWRRRAEVIRASGWRRLRIAGSVLAAVVLIAGLFGLAHTRLVSARHLRVSGASPARVGQVLAAAGLTIGQPMIDVHPSRAEHDLQLVPWVASASVRRVWPGTVRVVVAPRRAVAQVPTGSSPSGPVVEVDMTGRIIARVVRARPDLPVLLGVGTPGAVGQWLPQSRGAGWPIGSAQTRPVAAAAALSSASDAVSGALALTADLQTDGLLRGRGTHEIGLARIEVAADSTISAELSPGPVTVFFGAPTMLAAKAAALQSMLRAVTLTAGSVLDLQVPYRPTVTGSGATAAP